jgi:hypothetical protein
MKESDGSLLPQMPPGIPGKRRGAWSNDIVRYDFAGGHLEVQGTGSGNISHKRPANNTIFFSVPFPPPPRRITEFGNCTKQVRSSPQNHQGQAGNILGIHAAESG